MDKQTQYLLSLSKTELAEKMKALKIDINEADEKYQQALDKLMFLLSSLRNVMHYGL